MGIGYIPPPGGSVSSEDIQAAVTAYLTVHPPGIPDHAELPDLDESGHPASVIAGLSAVATSNSYDDLDDLPTLTEGPKGDQGDPGADGADGASAYEVAVANGFIGDETAWLASLHGEDGTNGTNGTNGTDGADGADGDPGEDGASAYELALANGFEGTLPEWLASLQGADGEDGAPGAKGDQGDPGEDGAPGTTDYNELDNLPTLGTAAAQNVAAFVQTATGSDVTHLWVGTETEYAAIVTPAATTVYVVAPD